MPNERATAADGNVERLQVELKGRKGLHGQLIVTYEPMDVAQRYAWELLWHRILNRSSDENYMRYVANRVCFTHASV